MKTKYPSPFVCSRMKWRAVCLIFLFLYLKNQVISQVATQHIRGFHGSQQNDLEHGLEQYFIQ